MSDAENKPLPLLLPGDCGLTASRTWLSKAIRFFGKLQTGEANRSHAFAGINNVLVIEALVRVRINDFTKYEDQDFELWRLPLSEQERLSFQLGMLKVAGDSYGWGKIPLHALDSTASFFRNFWRKKDDRKPVFWFTSKLGFSSFKDCSQLFVWGLHKFTEYRLRDGDHNEVKWKTVSPDYLQDLLHHPHNRAELVHKQKARK